MSTFVHNLRSLPRPFWILAGATFVNRFGIFVWPFLTIIITRNGNTAAQAGLAVGAYSVGSFIAAALGGWLADRMGRNVTMALSALGGAVCMMAMSQATAWQSLAVIAFFTGMISEAGQPAGHALVQDIVPEEQRVFAFAVQRFSVNLGWSFGPAVAGFLADYSFFWLFAVDAATSAFFGIIAWLFLPRGRRTPVETAGWSHAWSSIRQNRPFLALFAACLCVSWIFRQTSTTFPLHFELSGISMKWCGTVLAMNGIIICFFEMPLTSITRHWPVRPMIGFGYILMGGCFLVFLGSSALWAFGLAMVIFTVGEMLAFSRQQAYAASLAHDDMRGRYSGFLSLSWSIGGILASVGGLQLYQFSPGAAWLVAAGLGVVGAWLLARSR